MAQVESPYRVDAEKELDLARWKTDDTGPFKDKEEALKPTQRNLKKLDKLQGVLYAEARHAVLIVFQAMDAGGKDGATDHVFSGINPQGCSVTSFKAPTGAEQAHDFLWRIHAHIPPKGMIGIFNRSHYEDVLVVRVKELLPKSVWSKRYEQIRYFEEMLADEGTVILKFFLHISKDEQKRRMEARLSDPERNWKFNPGDLDDRALWDDYQKAYEEALQRTSAKRAPWFIVPADHKWYRNWVISDTVVRTLEKLNMHYPPPMPGLDKIRVK
ncbi:MAG TPA: polyphosphate kinase 2 family protein [Tepidisphaeraceae bacterium]